MSKRKTACYINFTRSFIICLSMQVSLLGVVYAEENSRITLRQDVEDVTELHVSVGKSKILVSPSSVKQLIIGNPEVADVRLLGSREILLLGKAPGTTNLAIRDKQEQLVSLIDVAVGYDLDSIKRKLYEVIPDQSGIEVRAANKSVILSGQVSSLVAMNSATAIVASYLPGDEGKIVNQLEVGGGQQVMLEVTVSEVHRDVTRDMGFDVDWVSGSLTLLTAGTNPLAAFVTATLDVTRNLSLTLTALEEKGLARILAEPKLIALSGQEASFLAGGEFAVPVAQETDAGGTTITVEFKEFGVAVDFTPIVLSSNRINLKLATEVSEPDQTLGIKSAGVSIPGLRTRRSSTSVELGDGESFMIAGLIHKDMNNIIDQLPGIGNLPVLGPLFRSTEFKRDQTELVIAVTPRLVKPVSAGKLILPSDNLVPPSEIDQYLRGSTEGSASELIESNSVYNDLNSENDKFGITGSFGHKF